MLLNNAVNKITEIAKNLTFTEDQKVEEIYGAMNDFFDNNPALSTVEFNNAENTFSTAIKQLFLNKVL